MAVAKLTKILILAHNSEKDDLLISLQRNGLFHITTVRPQTFSPTGDKFTEIINQVEETINFLSKFAIDKKRISMTSDAFEKYGEYDFTHLINETDEKRKKLSQLTLKREELKAEISRLLPFQNFNYHLDELHNLKRFKFLFGHINQSDFIRFQQSLTQPTEFFFSVVSKDEQRVYLCFSTLSENLDNLKNLLANYRFEIVDVSKYKGTIRANVELLEKKLNELELQVRVIEKELSQIAPYLPQLKITYDYLTNTQHRSLIEKNLDFSKNCLFIEGWIKERDLKTLQKLVAEFETAVVTPILPREDEEMPVALENSRLFKPFEVVLDFYGMPNPKELDPTPFLAPFFAIFFALCLTDAGYGLAIIPLAIYLLKRFPKAKKFLTLFLICGISTVVAGALTNGWFGNLIDQLGLNFLKTLKDKIVVFDPLKNPMIFFLLSLGLGYLHLNYGLLLEIYDSFRVKNPLPAIFNEFAWFLVLNSIVGYGLTNQIFSPNLKLYFISGMLIGGASIITLSRYERKLLSKQLLLFGIILSLLFTVASKIKLLPVIFANAKYLVTALAIPLLWLSLRMERENRVGLIASGCAILSFAIYHLGLVNRIIPLLLGIIAFLLFKTNRQLIKKLLWGVYNLYGGTGFLGVVLSYVRLMALGMVTAGIAMAVNTIAFMTVKVPVFGIIIAFLVLIIGHSYNLAVNILGAFVHTLRLNYVEFFPRFFSGGGTKFSPFKLETKYVDIKN